MRILRRRPVKIALDSALLIAFVVAFFTREPSVDPDYVLHSIVGLLIVPIVALHLTGNWGWVNRVATRRFQDREARLGLFNAVFGSMTAVCIVTGIPIWVSDTDMSTLSGLHTVTGALASFMVVIHLIWNQRRLRALFRRTTSPATTA